MLQVVAVFMIFFSLYIFFTKDEGIGAIQIMLSSVVFFLAMHKEVVVYETDPDKCINKAINSRMADKLGIPNWTGIKTRGLNYQSYKCNENNLKGGWLIIAQLESKSGGTDHLLIAPYNKKEENNIYRTNILQYLDHTTEPRSAPQMRRLLKSYGMIDDPTDIASKIATRMLMGNKKHRMRIRSPISTESEEPSLNVQEN